MERTRWVTLDRVGEPRGVVVVTGASSGIGCSCVLRLREAGFRVFACGHDRSEADKIAGWDLPGVEALVLDVTDAGSVKQAREIVEQEAVGAGLAGVVNNAGILVPGMLEFLPLARLQEQLAVNLIGTVAVTQEFLPLLRKGCGRIVNIGSVAGEVGVPFLGAYVASKHGLEGVNECLRREMRPLGVPVCMVQAALVNTPIWEKSSLSSVELLRDTIPEEGRTLYGDEMERYLGWLIDAGRRGTSADEVARRVLRTLTSRRPRARYYVGWEAFAITMATRVLPDSLEDRLLGRWLEWRARGDGGTRG